MNWFEYYFGHCFQTGWREIWNNFKMWRDLISGNYDDYAILSQDDPYEECYNWFWIRNENWYGYKIHKQNKKITF